jgi:hypothetical protein
MMLFGLNGNGKSSVAQRFIYSMAARGIVPMVFDPLKDEYGEMVEAMGGRVLRVGPRGRDKINLLHLGALGEAAAKIGGTTGEDMRRQAVSQAVDMVALVVQINRGSPLSDSEDAVLALMVRSVISRVRRPSMHDLVDAFLAPPSEVLSAVACNDAQQFLNEYRALHLSVLALLSGEMGALIGGSESMSIPWETPEASASTPPPSRRRTPNCSPPRCWQPGTSASLPLTPTGNCPGTIRAFTGAATSPYRTSSGTRCGPVKASSTGQTGSDGPTAAWALAN